MADILKSRDNVALKFVDFGDGTWGEKIAGAIAISGPSSTAGGAGTPVGVSGYGYLRVTDEPTALFSEPFDSLDTTNRWTTKLSTGTAAVTSGILTCASSGTALAYGGVYTQTTFQPKGLNYMLFGGALKFSNSTIADTKRFWGFGSVPGSPTVAVPITDGVGFELDGSGSLFAVVYEAGVKTQSADLTAYKVADGSYTRYLIVRRADIVFFYISDIYTSKAAFQFAGAGANTIPATFLAVAGAAPGASATMDVMQMGLGDTGKNAQSICDPTNPQFAATVKKASTAAVAADSALVVALHPSTVPAVTATGSAAEDAAASTSPVVVGGVVRTALGPATLVAGDAARVTMTSNGSTVTKPYAVPETDWQYATPIASPIANTTAVALKAANATYRNYVTGFTAYNNSATASIITIQDGSTVIYTDYLAANGSIRVTFPTPLRGTVNAAMNVVLNTTATSTFVSAQGYQAL